MKKILLVVLSLMFILSACQKNGQNSNGANESAAIRYYDMIDLINSYTNYATTSNYFDISGDISKIDEGYRYYIFIDNARVAMYDIEAMAIEKGVDYSNTMTANIGIFEDMEYHMIPNQTNVDAGYVGGMTISGVSQNAEPTLYVMVQWKNKNLSVTHRECYEVKLSYKEASGNDN